MIFCRFDKIVRLSSDFHRDMFLYKYNLKRERDKNIILKANNAKENFKILLQALYLHESSKELNELGCGVISAMDNALNNIDNYKRKKEERKKKSI